MFQDADQDEIKLLLNKVRFKYNALGLLNGNNKINKYLNISQYKMSSKQKRANQTKWIFNKATSYRLKNKTIRIIPICNPHGV